MCSSRTKSRNVLVPSSSEINRLSWKKKLDIEGYHLTFSNYDTLIFKKEIEIFDYSRLSFRLVKYRTDKIENDRIISKQKCFYRLLICLPVLYNLYNYKIYENEYYKRYNYFLKIKNSDVKREKIYLPELWFENEKYLIFSKQFASYYPPYVICENFDIEKIRIYKKRTKELFEIPIYSMGIETSQLEIIVKNDYLMVHADKWNKENSRTLLCDLKSEKIVLDIPQYSELFIEDKNAYFIKEGKINICNLQTQESRKLQDFLDVEMLIQDSIDDSIYAKTKKELFKVETRKEIENLKIKERQEYYILEGELFVYDLKKDVFYRVEEENQEIIERNVKDLTYCNGVFYF